MTYLFILTHSLVLSKSYRKTVVQSMQPILFPELSILQIKKYSFLYSLSCRFSLPAARPFIWLFDYLSSPIFGLFYIVITQSALFPFDFGIELLSNVTLLAIELLPEVANGMMAFPEKSYFSRKVLIGRGHTFHHIG